MIHQLRIYEIFDHNREAFHARFRDHAARIMARYGFDIRAMWECRSGERLEFVYLLAWPDEATLEDAWARFMADDEWARIKAETGAEYGPLVGAIEDRRLTPAGYGPSLPLEGDTLIAYIFRWRSRLIRRRTERTGRNTVSRSASVGG